MFLAFSRLTRPRARPRAGRRQSSPARRHSEAGRPDNNAAACLGRDPATSRQAVAAVSRPARGAVGPDRGIRARGRRQVLRGACRRRSGHWEIPPARRVRGNAEGVRVGRAVCTDLEGHLPYVPLAHALRDALADVDVGAVGLPALRRIFPELGCAHPARPKISPRSRPRSS